MVARGELWWGETPQEKGRPYLVVSRDAANAVRRTVLVAPVTRTVRGLPSELPVGPEEGLPVESVASFDDVQPMPKALLVRRIGTLARARHRLVRDELSKSIGHGSPAEVPAVLLARLALDQHLHGRGLGGILLADALQRVVVATALVAARFVVVDALHESAVAFYEHHGFRRIPSTRRLVQKLSDVAAALPDP